jgi:hypothetical protein
MPNLNRVELRARYNLFKQFAYDDQRQYYEAAVDHARKSAAQVNRLRAFFALATGFASALAGLLVQVSLNSDTNCGLGKQAQAITSSAFSASGNCVTIQTLANVLLALAVIAPAFAGALNILSDLYQWDRLTTIYSAALENMEVAYTYTPEDDMPDDEFKFSVESFGKDTLAVMSEETAQWGQSIRTPPTLTDFLRQEADKATRAGTDLLHAADKLHSAADIAEAAANAPKAPPFTEPSVG